MQNLKYDTNESIYKAETDSQRIDLRVTEGRDELGGWGQQIQASIYGMDKQKGPTQYSTAKFFRELYSVPYDKP